MFFCYLGRAIISVGFAFAGAIGIAAGGEDMGMVGQPIEQGSSEFFVGKDLYPLGEREIGSEDGRTALVTLRQQIE
jgi:hypothetical protein